MNMLDSVVATVKKRLCLEGLVALAVTVIWNESVYLGTKVITKDWYHFDMTLPVDDLVPFLPWTVSIYFGCFVVWGINYFLCALQEKETRDRFFLGDVLAKVGCLIGFLLLPSTNVRPEITEPGLWGFVMEFLYQIDSAENLFPSIHCLVSWMCWIGVRKDPHVPKAYRWFSLLMAVAVCISTLTTRQHVIVDVIGGVFLAEFCYWLAGRGNLSVRYGNLIGKIKTAIFRK